ncbi:hypothetical protein [Mesorhizobium sophorae]|uniref:hypothetical protein n=1 Tax=Mesorhizobium sophorae TaxID=1300294 RepID=UPI00117CBE67|nr:hypothetical protein [Mesorhizobium sophorae]
MTKEPRRAKTETLSLRLDPKTRFILELLSKIKGQNITVVVERAIRDVAGNTAITVETNDFGAETSRTTWVDYWDPDDGVRQLKLLAVAEYPTNFEEDELRSFTLTHWMFFYHDEKGTRIRRPYVEILWPKIEEYMTRWKEKKSEDYWAAGEAMQKALSAARVQPPEWPYKAKSKPKEARELDDEIPF